MGRVGGGRDAHPITANERAFVELLILMLWATSDCFHFLLEVLEGDNRVRITPGQHAGILLACSGNLE